VNKRFEVVYHIMNSDGRLEVRGEFEYDTWDEVMENIYGTQDSTPNWCQTLVNDRSNGTTAIINFVW
jgi:hypothetical protein